MKKNKTQKYIFPDFFNNGFVGNQYAWGGALEGAMSGAAAGSVIPGWGTAVGAVAGGLFGSISEDKNNKLKEEYEKKQVQLPTFTNNPYMPTFRCGGRFDYGGVKANSEIEGDEVVQVPQGYQPTALGGGRFEQLNSDTYKAHGRSHGDGGIITNLPQGTEISSDRLRKPNKEELTIAAAKEKLAKQRGKFEKTLELSSATETDKRTAKLMIDKIKTKEEDNFNQQEAMKEYYNTPQMTAEFGEGGIYIKPSRRGSFTKWAESHNMSVSEAAKRVMANKENYSSSIVKKANFAKNFAHAYGGIQPYSNIGNLDMYAGGGTTPTEPKTKAQQDWEDYQKKIYTDMYGEEQGTKMFYKAHPEITPPGPSKLTAGSRTNLSKPVTATTTKSVATTPVTAKTTTPVTAGATSTAATKGTNASNILAGYDPINGYIKDPTGDDYYYKYDAAKKDWTGYDAAGKNLGSMAKYPTTVSTLEKYYPKGIASNMGSEVDLHSDVWNSETKAPSLGPNTTNGVGIVNYQDPNKFPDKMTPMATPYTDAFLQGSEERKGINFGDVGYNLAAYAPTAYNLISGLFGKPYQYDPTKYQSTNYMKYNPVDMTKVNKEYKDQYAIDRANLHSANTAGSYMSNANALANSYTGAMGKANIAAQSENMKNKISADYYNYQIDAANKQIKSQIDALNLANRDQKNEYLGTAMEGISSIAQTNRLMNNTAAMDQLQVGTLGDIAGYYSMHPELLAYTAGYGRTRNASQFTLPTNYLKYKK